MTRRRGDPFGEGTRRSGRRRLWLLGACFEFTSDSPRLLALVDEAFAGLPAHRLPGARRLLQVELLLGDEARARRTPPAVPDLKAGAGMLCAHVDADNFAIVTPDRGRALVAVSRGALRQSYYPRYELLEFAVLTLAARAQRLVPLHAACVSHRGRGVLLIGDSGAGKTTLCAHALSQGLEFVSEDSVFVAPRGLLATGIGSFLHLRAGSAAGLPRDCLAHARRHIRRRSGERKRVLDVRAAGLGLARAPVKLAAVIVLRDRPARRGAALVRLAPGILLRSLRATQDYARRRPEWPDFMRRLQRLPGYELWRAGRAGDSALELARLLRGGSRP